MTKASSSITENLLGLIKSSDAQTAPSKQNSNSTISKKPQELPSILKKRSPEESPVISGSVYSLQTPEDSLSQGTGGVSEMCDEAMPILGNEQPGKRSIRHRDIPVTVIQTSIYIRVTVTYSQWIYPIYVRTC